MENKNQILIEGPISSSYIAESIAKHSEKTTIGGHSIFLGQVRADKLESKVVTAIQYSAYEDMVEKETQIIKDKIFAKYSDLFCLHIKHSTGIVKTGEISLFVFLSGGHRNKLFEACKETVELIKHKLPIWKKEIYEDNSYIWKE